jgi:hypothetical protein
VHHSKSVCRVKMNVLTIRTPVPNRLPHQIKNRRPVFSRPVRPRVQESCESAHLLGLPSVTVDEEQNPQDQGVDSMLPHEPAAQSK